ncbi:polyphosphate polymerase domain-containing protein [Cryomorphaceae bacterium 1068]|nr:polyphosphate polymerase domain-containing protein [Cryomorphaceae bacterium 1068]
MRNSDEYTVLENARFERKFVVENQSVQFVRQMIKVNPVGFRKVFQARRINNVYFDSPNLNNYYDNHFGKSARTKVRIRWYGDTFGKIENPILEFKTKRALVGKKKSYKLLPFELNSATTKQDLITSFQNSDLPEDVLNQVKRLVPTLLNSYEREYYKSFDSKYRITVDIALRFYNFKSKNNNFKKFAEEKNTIIVELKYDERQAENVSMITSQLPVRLNKFSKYVRGIEIFHPHLAV